MSVRIVTLVGSLRSGSHNRQLAEAAVKLAPAGTEIHVHEGLGDLPFYNEDIDAEDTLPPAAAALRATAAQADAFLLIAPEYNGTISAVLKNAIDWLSRPYGNGGLKGKPVAVIGTAFGRYGGEWAQADARKAAGIAGGDVVEDVTLAVPGSHTRFADTHPVDDTEVAEQLTSALARLTGAAASA